jgi:hypothetical protein
MTDVRLDVLLDEVSLSGHPIDGSLYVGDVWHRWRCRHGGDVFGCVACFAKGMVDKVWLVEMELGVAKERFKLVCGPFSLP